ncbi:MAG: heme lyase CcmF/NrfE family subunit [Chloroflexi bacterium]|nr:heme lyase CcmF/NrfE family subunit [Chloroflexota bacterium]
MIEIGKIAIVTGLIFAAFTAVVNIMAARSNTTALHRTARRGVLAVAGLTTIASIALFYAILSHKFQVAYVYQYSAMDLSTAYLISVFWAGNEGSLLFWAWLLSIFAVIVIYQTRNRNKEIAPYALCVMMVVQTFFMLLLAFVSDPFRLLPVVPPDGNGLNPLLENPGMFTHPTTLFLGYVGITVPFAFAMAALITGKLNDQWIRSTRRWTLFAWLFLSLGNLFGAQWAYVELGWGGYWAWDPVESASFMPWLVATGYLHSVMIQQRRGMLKVWNIVLILITFILVIFGTFLTRSGVLASVHSFGQSNLGPFFLGFMGITLVYGIGMLVYRLPELKSENELDSLVSRESSFLLNNLFLVGAAFAVFLGTVFPVISEAVRGVKITVGPPFFNSVTGPIFLGLIALMGVCPLIGWRRASKDNLIRNFMYPLVLTLIITLALFAAGQREGYVLLAWALCSFVISSILLEVFRGVRTRHRTRIQGYVPAFVHLVWSNKPRYGGYIVHIGIILMAIAIVASNAYKAEATATLAPGQSMNIRNYTLTYDNLSNYPVGTSRNIVVATMTITNSGEELGILTPAKTFSIHSEQPVSEVSIRTTLKEDLYAILSGWDKDGASFKVFINPMVAWLWIGGAVLIFGTIIAMWPDAREKRRELLGSGLSDKSVEEEENDEA